MQFNSQVQSSIKMMQSSPIYSMIKFLIWPILPRDVYRISSLTVR